MQSLMLIKWNGFYAKDIHDKIQNTNESDAILMQWQNILCKLAQCYYTHKTFFLTVKLMVSTKLYILWI